jgi:hypothetical protein
MVEAIVPGHGLSGCGPAVGFAARSSSPMPYGSSSAAGDVAVARTSSRITRAMQPSAARRETSGPRPKRQPMCRSHASGSHRSDTETVASAFPGGAALLRPDSPRRNDTVGASAAVVGQPLGRACPTSGKLAVARQALGRRRECAPATSRGIASTATSSNSEPLREHSVRVDRPLQLCPPLRA